MSNIFQKAKLAFKFRRAGEGHKLNDNTSQNHKGQQPRQVASRKDPTCDAQRAGQAALERLSQQEKTSKPPKSATATWKDTSTIGSTSRGEPTSLASDRTFRQLKNQVKAEIESERVAEISQTSSADKPLEQEATQEVSEVYGIYYNCPFCEERYEKQIINAHMEQCLNVAFESDKMLTPVNMIKSLNKDPTLVENCLEILCKYLDNIILNPDEAKYRKIKKTNKVFQQKVIPVKGSEEFLVSCGFVEKPATDNEGETCFLLEDESSEVGDRLTLMKEVLLGTERMKPRLDRATKILQHSQCPDEAIELSDDFFELNSEELKQLQSQRSEEVERNSQLRTKAMRDAERKNTTRVYKFTLLRIRFPDQVILQGTFYSGDKVSSLLSFVREHLEVDWLPFVLCEPGGRQVSDEDATFTQLGLVPAAILNFSPDSDAVTQLEASGTVDFSYLKHTFNTVQ